MAKLTIRQRLEIALASEGYKPVATKAYKYTVWTKDNCSFLFLGKAGSLRKGRIFTESYPVDRLKERLLGNA